VKLNFKIFINNLAHILQELTELVKRFRAYGAEINGIGIQGHTKDYVKPDPLMIWVN
jgi:GH35 family endo-1,4-beta-xylanase